MQIKLFVGNNIDYFLRGFVYLLAVVVEHLVWLWILYAVQTKLIDEQGVIVLLVLIFSTAWTVYRLYGAFGRLVAGMAAR